ncbi:MAG: hypothetical protein IIU76_02185, partial [Bacteroidales bacterium]|nr:hypothetical protein [Bacteroidales bacterium]
MDQIYVDTLKTVMVYKYELDAAVLELERISLHNTILCCVLAVIVAGVIVAAYYLGLWHNKKMNAEKFANRL